MTSKGSILVVDDDLHVRKVLRRFLEKMGFEVILAENGREALELFRAKRPALVLLDIVMPGMSGTEVLREMMKADPGARVLMLTAIQDEAIGKRCLLDGARDYLCKPFELEDLKLSLTVNAFLSGGD